MNYRNVIYTFLLSTIITAVPMTAFCADSILQAIGVRMGWSMTEKYEYFHQYEAFTVFRLPWEWRSESGWGLSTQLNATGGLLHGGNRDGFVGSLGPGFSFNKNGKGVQFEMGMELVGLTEEVFGKQDFGGNVLFQGHGSLSYIFQNGLGIGYRAQHSSNAGLYATNPGYDLHMVSLSWNF